MSEHLVLVHRDDLAVIVTGLVAFSVGFSGRLVLRLRKADLGRGRGRFHPFRHRFGDDEVGPEVLRFGLEFADGRRATSLDPFPVADPDPPAISLMQRGGGGGGRGWDHGFWVYPLPPPGAITFAVEWPACGIELVRTEGIDGESIRAAAALSERLWQE